MYKYKIAILGKAKSGKNTVAKMIAQELLQRENISCDYIAFADPIKSMIRIMFPELPEQYLTGPSEFRASIVPNAYKDEKPLSVRQLLIDIGTGLGRTYNPDVWLDVFDHTVNTCKSKNKLTILTDCRFKNELKHVKSKGFFALKIIRDDASNINHITETEQDSIPNSEFDYILYNNGSLGQLEDNIKELVNVLSKKD